MKICTTEQEFIDTVAPAAQRVCKRYGFYLPSVLIAQACKENGYGIRSYWDNPGVEALVTYNNMVGIKQDLLNKSWVDVGLTVWPGKYLNKLTPEVYNGKPTIIPDDFRIYDNIEQSFADYLCFMRWGGYSVGNPKYYNKIKDLKDPAALIRQVHSLGYATGTTYSSGVIKIIQKHGLTRYDDLTGVEPSAYYPAAGKGEKTMGYTNSGLVEFTKPSPNNSGMRTHSIDRITPHCVVGQLSVETMGAMFAKSSYQAAPNYGIGSDGRVGMYVQESMRSWCSSSSANDQRAVTIECASDKTHPYAFKDIVYKKLIKLCTDICKRNGKTKLLWFGDKEKTLGYKPAADEMILTVHRWFANKACPGDWMYARMGDLAKQVTEALGGTTEPAGKDTVPETGKIYRVQVGAYSQKANAEKVLKQVFAAGFDAFITDKQDGYYRVQVGAYSKYSNAVAKKAAVQNAGFKAIIKTYTVA